MIRSEIQFYSTSLGQSTAMTVLLPDGHGKDDPPVPVLYLLHGRSDDHSGWCRYTSLERYLYGMRLAVVMPDAHLSYYQNMKYGPAHFDFISRELPDFCETWFPVSRERSGRFIAGLSMGGFGAVKCALNYPERFGSAGSFSGPLDFPSRVERSRKKGRPADKTLFAACFGEDFRGSALKGTENDLIHLLEGIPADRRPRLYQCCGTKDLMFHKNNLRFKEAAEALGADLSYSESEGKHNWEYWDGVLPDFLDWLIPVPLS